MTSTGKPGRPRHILSSEQFQRLLLAVGTGTPVPKALKRMHIGEWVLRRHLRANPAWSEEWQHAVRWGLRQNYSKFVIEDALREVATSGVSFMSALRTRGITNEDQLRTIRRWTEPGKDLEQQFLSAKASQERLLRDGLIHKYWGDETAGTTRRSRSAINKDLYAVHKTRPLRFRKAEAASHRAAFAQRDPQRAELMAARRRAKRAAARVRKIRGDSSD